VSVVERGTLTSINADGFGFIASDRTGSEIWLAPRGRDLDTGWALRVGQRVEFEIAFGALGLEASSVRPLEP
jgi:cold shock CspA family protein